MGKLFGTDGIRGIANRQLTPELAYRVGQAAALVLRRDYEGKPVVVIGKDTRISSDMLEGAITAGLTACGVNVHTLGVISTPAVALITVRSGAAAGIVISASHNPDGSKLPDEVENAIEDLILSKDPLPVCENGDIGITYDDRHAMDAYIRYLVSTVKGDPHELRVLVDCANGAASVTAQRIFARYDLDVTYINDKPNGVNINAGCGSTHLEELGKLVAQGCYDVGIAFDGDLCFFAYRLYGSGAADCIFADGDGAAAGCVYAIVVALRVASEDKPLGLDVGERVRLARRRLDRQRSAADRGHRKARAEHIRRFARLCQPRQQGCAVLSQGKLLLTGHVQQPLGDFVRGDPAEGKPLTPGEDRGGDFVDLRGGQNENQMLRGLLQDFQQGVEGGV